MPFWLTLVTKAKEVRAHEVTWKWEAIISGHSKWGWRLPKVADVFWVDSRARFLIYKYCCSVGRRCRLEGGHEDVETSPSPMSPFSSAVSPPDEVGSLSSIWPLPVVCYSAKAGGSQPWVPRDLFTFFMLYLAVSLSRFLWPPLVVVPCVNCANSTCRGRVRSKVLGVIGHFTGSKCNSKYMGVTWSR